MQHTAWKDFNTGVWDKAVDVRDFIQRNYIPYEGTIPSLLVLQNEQQNCGNK